jgi:hypothetical protein
VLSLSWEKRPQIRPYIALFTFLLYAKIHVAWTFNNITNILVDLEVPQYVAFALGTISPK